MIVYRPLQRWDPPTTEWRAESAFSAGWDQTLTLLQREADMLDDSRYSVEVVIEIDGPITKGGVPFSRAAVDSPRVAVSFESRHGPLRYQADTYGSWRDNVRAIALSLQALRAVSRWGLGARGEQYTGWTAIGTGRPMPAGAMTVDEAKRFMAAAARYDVTHAVWGPEQVNEAYRRAAKILHPDVGGDPAMFRQLTDARDLLIGAST